MTWAAWKELHPSGRVVSDETGHRRDYGYYPYGDYESLTSSEVMFPVRRIDDRRPIKERVLGIPDGGGGGIAFPYGLLDESGPRTVVNKHTIAGKITVLWDRDAAGATAFHSITTDGQIVNIDLTDGEFTDHETGSVFNLDGRGVSGPLAGATLEPVDEAYVAFWFTWAIFQPRTEVWGLL